MNPKVLTIKRPVHRWKGPLWLAAFMAAVLFVSGCSMLPREEEALAPPLRVPEQITYETLEVKKADIERRLRVTGRFISVSQSHVQFTEQGGRIQDILVKTGQKVKAGDVLATLNTADLSDDLQLQRIALQRAQLAYEKSQKLYEADGGINKYDLELSKLEVDSQRIRLNAFERALTRSKLIAPIDGDITYVANLKTGDWVDTYSTVVTVADPAALQLRYSDDRVGEFVTGMQVSVIINQEPHEGEVVMTPVDLPFDAQDSMKNTVLFEVAGIPEGTRIGSDAQVIVILERSEDTIVLPRYTLNKNFGRTYVNILTNNIREERDVEVGIQSETEVEILKGLELGEFVIVR